MQAPSSRRPGIGGILLLIGYFAIFCSVLLFGSGGWRWMQSRIQSGWPVITAQVDRCRLDVVHPFSRDGGGTRYSLRCKLNFEFADASQAANVFTTSTPDPEIRDEIDHWAAGHPQGAHLRIRVNPRDPSEVLIQDSLPIQQRATARDGLVGGIIFAGGGGILLVTGLWLRRAAPRQG